MYALELSPLALLVFTSLCRLRLVEVESSVCSRHDTASLLPSGMLLSFDRRLAIAIDWYVYLAVVEDSLANT